MASPQGRLAAFQAELAACEPSVPEEQKALLEGVPSSRGGTLPPPGAGTACVLPPSEADTLDVCHVLRRNKFMLLSVFAEVFLSESRGEELLQPDSPTACREADDRSNVLKEEAADTMADQWRVHGEILEAYEDASRECDLCQQQLARLEQSLAEEAAGGSGQVMGEPAQGASWAPGELLDDELKRRRLDDEVIGYVERVLAEPKVILLELEETEAAVVQEDTHMKGGLAELVASLGLPRISLDDATGVIELGGVAERHGAEDATCRVRIRRGAGGELLLVEPHPSLGLQDEAARAVDSGDIARLLTLVRNTVASRSEAAARGGG